MMDYQLEQAFLKAIGDAGLSPNNKINFIADGVIHRYQVDGDKSGSKNGWYVLHIDGDFGAGAFGSWKTGETQNWCSKSTTEFSPAERAAWQKKQADLKAERDKAQELVWQDTRKKAAKLWDVARPAAVGQHPYLVAKNIKPFGVKILNGNLVIPVRNASGELTGLQFISSDGKKKFLTGTQKTGSYCAIGKPDNVLLICEGFATGASLREATGYAVAVAFDAGNLSKVARVLREKFSDLILIICGDNDQTTEGNPGMWQATDAGYVCGGMALVPTFEQGEIIDGKEPTDFNDLHRLHGLAAVKTAIDRVMTNSQPKRACGDGAFDTLIADSNDFDYLTGDLLKKLAMANLSLPKIEKNIIDIAKKTGVSRKTLKTVYESHVNELSKEKNKEFISKQQEKSLSKIEQLNQVHAVIPLGGKIVVVNYDHDPVMHKKVFSFSSAEDFKLRYCNDKIYQDGKMVGFGKYWLEHPLRAEHKGLVFLPGGQIDGYLNLWRGWGLVPGGDESACAKIKDFVHALICSGNDVLYDYLIKWMAHMVQRPQELPETAIVMRGREGTGKNTLLSILADIVGREHYLTLTNLNQVTGRFSGHLANALLVFCNESIAGNDKSSHMVLRSMITDTDQPIEYKGKDLTMVKSFRRMIFASNDEFAVPRGVDDRRNVIVDVSDARRGDHEFWKALNAEIDNGGKAAFFAYLLKQDLSGWHPKMIPNELLQNGWEIKIKTASSTWQWLFYVLQNGGFAASATYSDVPQFPERLPFSKVVESYTEYCNAHKIRHIEHPNTVGSEMSKLGVRRCRPRTHAGKNTFYIFPTLEQCRENFCKVFNMPVSYWANEEE